VLAGQKREVEAFGHHAVDERLAGFLDHHNLKMELPLTLVVSTLPERHGILPRFFEYHQSLDCRKILVDSARTKPIGHDLWDTGVNYILRTDADVYEKVSEALSLVETPYVIMMADDDFVLPGAVVAAVRFLLKNPRYVAANGQQVKMSEPEGALDESYGRWQYFHLRRYPVVSKSCVKRFNRMFRAFFAPTHAVLRTDVLCDAIRLVAENRELRPVRFFDKILGFIVAVKGNSMMLPVLFQIRSGGPRLVDQRPDSLPDAQTEFDEMLGLVDAGGDPLSRYLADHSGIPATQAERITSQVLRQYWEQWRFGPAQQPGWLQKKAEAMCLPSHGRKARREIEAIRELVRRLPCVE
jgi:glycosyltransferase domain-containing protein